MFSPDECQDPIERKAARLGDARRLEAGVLRRDVRVEPGAGRGHGVDRNRDVRGETVERAVGVHALAHGVEEVSFVGPRFEAELEAPS